eukprot:6482045-Amphidinium_carterae.1
MIDDCATVTKKLHEVFCAFDDACGFLSAYHRRRLAYVWSVLSSNFEDVLCVARLRKSRHAEGSFEQRLSAYPLLASFALVV